MSDNKSLDGIKKLNNDSLKKARNIVLRSIGENKESAEINNALNKKNAATSVKMDGILARGSKRVKDVAKISAMENKKMEAEQIKIKEEEKNILLAELKKQKQISRAKSLKQAMDAMKKNIEKNKKIKEKKEEERKEEEREERENREKIEKKEMNKRKRIADKERKKMRKKQRKNRERIKKEEIRNKKRIKKLALKELLKEKRKKKKIIIKQKIKKVTLALKYLLFNKIFCYSFLLILIAFYIGFFIALCGFNLDNDITRSIAKHIPVPVIVTKIGVIEYYDYKDAEDSLLSNKELALSKMELKLTARKELIKALVIDSLIKKYNIQTIDKQLIIDEIRNRIITDQEINSEALLKLSRFRRRVEAGQDFYKVAKNYIDDFSAGTYYSNSEAVALFGPEIVNMELGQVSDVVVGYNGYYIAQCYGKEENLIGLKYIFVKSKSLEEYIYEVIQNLKMISFIG